MTHFWIPRIQILENTREIATPSAGAGGYFSIAGTLPDGRSRTIAEWQPNLITDIGLERWGTGAPVTNCSVGAGNAPPTVNDTALQAYLRQSSSVASTSYGAQSAEPYYGWLRLTFRFNPPGSNLNLSEIGFGWGANGEYLWSRALIKNAEGVPITVSWLGTETLEVTYEIRKYPWLDDVPYETTISGQTYTGVMRASMVTSNTEWRVVSTQQRCFDDLYGSVTPPVYDGAIGAITSSPSGATYYDSSNKTENPYLALSLKKTGVAVYPADKANFSGGISALRHGNSVGTYQMSIDPPIPKVADFTLTLNIETPTWGRYP